MRLSRLWREEEGQALLYVAIFATVLVGLVYYVYDSARLFSAKIQSQNAADASALAAVALKANVHNTRTLAYLAMTEQANLSRIEMMRAMAALGKEAPGSPTALAAYRTHLDLARKATKRVKKLRAGLVAYNAWIQKEGPELVAQAARTGYLANIGGMNERTPLGGSAETQNMSLLSNPSDLRENGGSAQMLGAVNYLSEGTSGHGNAGKTYVEIDTKYSPLGLKMMKYKGGDKGIYSLHARAAAGPFPLEGLSYAGFNLNWYVPRLFRVGKKHGETYDPKH
ncbi:MAG TPA: hypothetical protein DD435_14200 [Cyanobacteria bacterium UBA8530]|nr:hypothetical protein [Cyanobacteria bacterium UBA8530]